MAASRRADDPSRGRRIGRVWLVGVVCAALAAFVFPQAIGAAAPDATIDAPNQQPDYVPTTTEGERSIKLSAFSPVCIVNAPYIQYAITPVGFTSSGPATLTFFDANGNFVEQVVVPTLSGVVIYPGASVDANGNATDWPGWKQAENGNWIPDDSDAILRRGLSVTVEVNPTATTTVSYPSDTSGCANPPTGIPPTTLAPTTTICVGPGSSTGGNTATTTDPCDPCVPATTTAAGSSTANGAESCTLPRTGGDGVVTLLAAGALALGAGILITMLARRRRSTPTAV